jgi:gamma-glutamyltranspeptidase/glutathione hydrolase
VLFHFKNLGRILYWHLNYGFIFWSIKDHEGWMMIFRQWNRATFLIGGSLAISGILSSCSSVYKESRQVEPYSKDVSTYQSAGTQWTLATQGRAASHAGEEIFQQGGNVVDAAVATSIALGVERPHSTGIGGGGFLLLKFKNVVEAWDFREVAPRKAYRDMFLGKNGAVIPDATTEGARSSGVPGLLKGLYELHKRHGKLPWATVLQPAIRLAKNGFPVYPELAAALKDSQETLAGFPSSHAIFFRPNGDILEQGDRLVQYDLSRTLERVAKNGSKELYFGKTAQMIAASQKQHKGLIDLEDLKSYQFKIRDPLRGKFKGYEIVTMPPPSGGGMQILEVLKTLEKYPLKEWGPWNPKTIHTVAAAMQQSFADRTQFAGDPEFTLVPIKGLLSDEHIAAVQSQIDSPRALEASQVKALSKARAEFYESNHTVHFSILDAEGNAVVSTQTINGWFGSGIVAEGTGIVMNNEMDDFSAKKGAVNQFGQVGNDTNLISAGRRPLSSMSPTLVFKDNEVVAGLGTPSGTRIPTCILNVLLNRFEHEMSLSDAVATLRYHHQWYPDQIEVEPPGFSGGVQSNLESMGYKIENKSIGCKVQMVEKAGDKLRSVSDIRGEGLSLSH